jgi:hypothetical protein
MYSDIVKAAQESNVDLLMEMDFVLKCNTLANDLLRKHEDDAGTVDYNAIEAEWEPGFKALVDAEVKASK